MKYTILIPVCLLAIVASTASSQTTANDGDWDLQQVEMTNTPEAALMVRYGDIDNLGFGWPGGFDPFSGNSTPSHGFPWAAPTDTTDGTDRIMVITSYNGAPPHGWDGYTSGTSRPSNSVRPISLSYNTEALTVTDATFQIFVDDFQAPVWGAQYKVTLNGQSFPELEAVINTLSQTGPVGKLVTVPIPPTLLPQVASGSVSLVFDDLTTGAGDGFAIDFVKLLVNSTGTLQTGSVSGKVTDAFNGEPLAGTTVEAFNQTTTTLSDGTYTLDNVPAGLALVSAQADGFLSNSVLADVVAGNTTANKNIALARQELQLFIAQDTDGVEVSFYGHTGVTYHLQSGITLDSFNSAETILGTGAWVRRTNAFVDDDRRFWRVVQ